MSKVPYDTQRTRSLIQARLQQGWSQAVLAEKVGVDVKTINRWERGNGVPFPVHRAKLGELLHIDPETIWPLPADSSPLLPDEKLPSQDSAAASLPHPSADTLFDPALPSLPEAASDLIGRKTLAATIKEHLFAASPACPAHIALYGLPGVGKTLLATALAYDPEVQEHFCDGILWGVLGQQSNVLDLLSRWGALLGIAPTRGANWDTSSWAAALRDRIGRRRMLVMLDDPWDIDAALECKIGGPYCAYLLTTRSPDLAYQFTSQHALVIPELTAQESVDLLTHLAPSMREQEPQRVQELVQTVGGLPLALTLIGKYLHIQASTGQPRHLRSALERLGSVEERFRLTQPQSSLAHHSSLPATTPLSLAAVIEISVQTLPEKVRHTLAAFSLFPGKPNSFAEEAALSLPQVSIEEIDHLLRAGLLESASPGRYTLHQTIADHAHLGKEPQHAAHSFAQYYRAFAERYQNDHEQLATESTNLLAALEVAYTAHCYEDLVCGVCAMADFLYLRGLYSLAEKHLKRAYEAAKVLGDTTRRVRALLYLGQVEQDRSNQAQAKAYLLEGLELARKVENTEQICDLLRTIGMVEDAHGNQAQAQACFREGLELARRSHLQKQACRLLAGLGVQAGKRGEYAQAEAYLQEGLALAKTLEYRERMVAFLHNLGRVAYERGDYAQAEEYYRETLKQARRSGYAVAEEAVLLRFGELTLGQGNFIQSHEYLESAAKRLRRLGATNWLIDTLFSLGKLAVAEGDDERAEGHFLECLEMARRPGVRETIVTVYAELAQLEARRGHYEQAETYLCKAEPLARELGLSYLVGMTLYARGELHLQRQQVDEAALNFAEMRSVVATDYCELQGLALFGLARAAHARHDLPAARQQGENCLALFAAIGHYRAAEIEQWLKHL